MIYTIIIFVCTVINCAWGFYWIKQLNYKFEEIKDRKEREKRTRHVNLCLRCIEVGSCPHDCERCAWGDVMTEKHLKQEKKVRKFWKKILE